MVPVRGRRWGRLAETARSDEADLRVSAEPEAFGIGPMIDRRGRKVMGVRAVLCAAVSAALALVVCAVWNPRAHADEGAAASRPSPPRSGGTDRAEDRVWPVAGRAGAARPAITRGWEPPPKPWAAGHRGVDLAAPRGSPVRAVAGGRVSFAGSVAGRGVVSVELPGMGRPPLRTTYEPVRASVHNGQRVRAGQTLGTVTDGTSHCGSTCLHWGARKGEHYLDPLSLLPEALLRGGPSRLLPVFGVPLPRGRGTAGSGSGGSPETAVGRYRTHKMRPAAAETGPDVSGAQAGATGWALPVAAGLGSAAICAHRQLTRAARHGRGGATRAGRIQGA
ncbi:M23 family metallopeptidase [Streptomyces marispadix]|uniref:M23 family metallopeptidase n=1 Tax=Streptomyces marispadix TaxID=2922868 RepID=UPI0035582A07